MNNDQSGRILIVDDTLIGRISLAREVTALGHSVETATNGLEALEKLGSDNFDVVLLDMVMPGLSGEDVLERIRQNPQQRGTPVVMVSSADEFDTVVRCIAKGAEDYLPKPPNSTLLRARLHALIERKRLRDQEQKRADELRLAKEDSERLLLNILPATVAQELTSTGLYVPRSFDECTVVFTDFVGFSQVASRSLPQELVSRLNRYFTAFDHLCDSRGLEKIKTLGDSYMYAAGIPSPRPSHAVDAVSVALEMVEILKLEAELDPVNSWPMRVGVHSGPLTAGVVGIRKFCFDIWGETVNLASRMQSSGVSNRLNVSQETLERVLDFFFFEPRGPVPIKGGLERSMYFITAAREDFESLYHERFGVNIRT